MFLQLLDVASDWQTRVVNAVSTILTPILIIGCSGCAVADFSQKIFVTSINGSVATFNFFTYAFGLALLLITYGTSRRKCSRADPRW